MTFCFVFLAHNRGGVGIVSDRRISTTTTFGDVHVETDDATKVVQLTETSGVAVAGNLKLLGKLTQGLPSALNIARQDKRIEVATKFLGDLYHKTTTDHPEFQDPTIGASMILFDTYRSRSSQRYRIKKLAFEFNNLKRRAEITLSGGGKTDYLTIGASKAVRTQLGRMGASAMSELANHKGEYRTANKREVENLRAKHQFDTNAQIFILDTTKGEPLARATSNVRSNAIGDRAPNYTSLLAMAASNAIANEIGGMHKNFYPGSYAIGPNLHVGVFEAGRGLKLASLGSDS